jgi:CHAT domain-containing protein
LSNLAALYLKKKDYLNAEKYCIESSRILISHTQKNWISFSEEEKLKWWENEKGFFQFSPSLLYSHPSASSDFIKQTCVQQLQLKGFVLNNGANVLQQVRKSGNAQLQQLVTLWQSNKSILSKQYSLPALSRMQDLDEFEKSTNDLEKQINQRSAVFSTNQQNQQIDFEKVQQHLKPGEAAIEFIRFNYYNNEWTDSILYAAFVILPGETNPRFVPICEERALSRLLDSKLLSSEQFIKQIYRGGRLGNNKTIDGKKGDSIYNLVWKPLLPWLNGVKKISIAPAGLLNRVAFNALPADNNTYLIDKYQLRQYNSVRQIAEVKIPVAPAKGTIDIALYGGIAFSAEDTIKESGKEITTTLPDEIKRSMRGGNWSSLPGTLKEVNSIRQLYTNNKKSPKTITGSAATEESLKELSGHSPVILHLATHGFSLPNAIERRKNNTPGGENQFSLADNPLLRSGIIMAGANRVWNGAEPAPGKEDGIVTAYEISTLDLSNTELVVLSACETALGDIKGTEGVFGLQRAFKLAGVQNMLLSLWQVPDAETAELMNLLYSNKLNGMNTQDAFNRAQETMRKKYPPYYWAAFVLFE